MKGSLTALFLLIASTLCFSVRAEGEAVALLHTVDAKFYGAVKGIVDTPDPLMTPSQILTEESVKEAAYQKARQDKLKDLVKSIEAIEDKEVRLTDQDKLQIAEAALHAQEQTGVDAVFLVALARMESDFRQVSQVNASCKAGIQQLGCYADCGMTQHHIRGPAKYVNARCKQLAKDPKATFLLSAQEISSHVKWCSERAHQSWNRPLRRCVLNRYNMGPYYKTSENCKQTYNCGALRIDLQRETWDEFQRTVTRCKAQERKCLVKAAYWERLTCFEYGARKQIRSTRNCRWCMNVSHINTFFYVPAVAPAKIDSNLASSPIKSDQTRRNQPQ